MIPIIKEKICTHFRVNNFKPVWAFSNLGTKEKCNSCQPESYKLVVLGAWMFTSISNDDLEFEEQAKANFGTVNEALGLLEKKKIYHRRIDPENLASKSTEEKAFLELSASVKIQFESREIFIFLYGLQVQYSDFLDFLKDKTNKFSSLLKGDRCIFCLQQIRLKRTKSFVCLNTSHILIQGIIPVPPQCPSCSQNDRN